MKTTTTMTAADGSQYDIPSDEMDAFKTDFPDAKPSSSYRVGGDEYVIPQDEDEAFRKDFADAEKTRTIQFANGKTRQFTANELSRFLRSKEFREGDEFKGDRAGPVQTTDQGGSGGFAEGYVGGLADAGGTAAGRAVGGLGSRLFKFMGLLAGSGDVPDFGQTSPFADVPREFKTKGQKARDAKENRLTKAGEEIERWTDILYPAGKQTDSAVANAVGKVNELGIGLAEFALTPTPILAGGHYADGWFAAYDAGKERGLSDEDAAKLGDARGAIDAVITTAFKNAPVHRIMKALGYNPAPAVVEYLAKNGTAVAANVAKNSVTSAIGKQMLVSAVASAGEMGVLGGVQAFADEAIMQEAKTGKIDWDRCMDVAKKSAVDQAAFGAVMGALPTTVRIAQARRQMDRALGQSLSTEAGRTAWRETNAEGADSLARAYREDGHVSRRVAKDAGLPEMPQAERDALAREIADLNDARARRNRVRPDEQQSNALTQEIAKGGADIEQQGRIYEDVLSNIRDAKELDDPARREELVRDAEKRILDEERPERARREQAEDDAATAAEERRWEEANNKAEERKKAAEEIAARRSEEEARRSEEQKEDDEATAAEEKRWAESRKREEERKKAAEEEARRAEEQKADDAATSAEEARWAESRKREEARKKAAEEIAARRAEERKSDDEATAAEEKRWAEANRKAEEAAKNAPQSAPKETASVARPEAADAPAGKEGVTPAKTETVPDGKGKMVEVPAYGDDYKARLKGRPKGQRRDTKKARAEWDELQKAKAEKQKESATPTKPAEAAAAKKFSREENIEALKSAGKGGGKPEYMTEEFGKEFDRRLSEMSDAEIAVVADAYRRMTEAKKVLDAKDSDFDAESAAYEDAVQKFEDAVDKAGLDDSSIRGRVKANDTQKTANDAQKSADQYADSRKVLKEKFFQDEASLKRQMDALPPQAKRLRKAYEAAIRFAKEKSSLSAQADGERTGRYRAEIDVKTQAQKLDLNDPANIPYMRWLRKNARVNTPGARRDFDRQQAKAAEAVVRNFVPDGKVVYHEGGAEVPDGARMAIGVKADVTVDSGSSSLKKTKDALLALAGKPLKNDATGITAEINATQRNKMTSNAATRKSVENGFSVAEHNAATANIENLWKHAELVETRPDSSGDKNIASIKRFLSPVYFGSKEAFAYITAKESVRDGHRIYSIEIEKLESIDGKLKGGFPSTSIDSANIISKLRSKVNGPETRNLYSKDGSVVGWFDKSTRTTHLLPGADAATVAHEIGWHASYDHAERLAAKGDRALLDKLNAFADNAPQQVKNDIAARYGNVGVVDPAVIREEVGAARYTMDNVRKITDEVQRRQAANWYRKAWDSCVDAYKSMLTKAGYNKVNLDAMNAMTPEAAVDFMAKEMARGKSLGKVGDRSKIDMGGKAVGVKQTLAAARDAYMWKMKDYRQPLKGLDEDLRKAGMDIGLFREARLQPGRQQKWADHVESKTKEFFDLCRKDGVDYAEVNEYMWAQAAAERNAKTRSATGAAMTDAEAADILARYQASPKAAALAKISDLLLDLQREGLEFRRDSGLLSDDLFNKWTAEEPHHVPMKSPIVDGEYVGRDGGGRVGRPEFKTARGRTNLGDDPVGWIFAEALDAHLRGEENMLRRRLLPALIVHPEIGRFYAAADGSPKELRTRKGEGAANVLEFKHDGQSWIMELNGARGEAVQAAMNGRNLVSAPKWMQTANRLWASTATQLSLTFTGRNALADNIDVIGINYAENGFVKGTAANARHFRNMVRAYPKAFVFARTGKTSDPSLQAYVDAGGLIGGVGNEGYTSIAEGIRKDFASGKKNPVALVKAFFRGIKVLNETVELATRVGDFENQVAMKKSVKDAALHSREVSVDFNQKGEWTGVTNIYRMFSNSTLGATVRQVSALVTGKYGRRAALGMFGFGLLEGLLECAVNGDESDAENAGKSTGADVTEYTRANSIYFRKGEKVYRVPFHAGPFSLLKYAGNCAARKLMGVFNDKNTTATKAQTELANEALGVLMQFTGLGDAGPDVLQTVAPTLLQPVIQMLTNTDYAGRPIERTAFNKNDPKAYNGRESTPARYKWLAEGLNDVSGGNRGRRGALDVSPEYLKYGLEQAGKNAMRDVENVVSVVGMMAGVEKKDPRNMPGVRDYYRPQDGNDARYFRAIDRYSADENDWKRNLASRTPEERRAYMAEHPWLRRAGGAKTRVAELEGRIRDLRQLEKGLAKNSSGSWVERRTKPTDEQVEAWRAKRRGLQAKVISLVGGE